MTNFPALEPVKNSSITIKYNRYKIELRSRVVFEYLFNAKSHRWIDKQILMLDSNKSLGYQSMAILHFIGLKKNHKGIFQNYKLSDALKIIYGESDDKKLLVDHLTLNAEENRLSKRKFYKDGLLRSYLNKTYERNPVNRRIALKEHGLNCLVCDFNFEKTYGEIGKDFIEVHHIIPLSSLKKEVVINPKDDLVTVCSNCHRMIHRLEDQMLSIEQLKNIIKMNTTRSN